MNTKKEDIREIFSYVMVRDTGRDPNPYNGTLDLISCKPKIRKKAKKGDILVGTWSTRSKSKFKWLSKKLVYAAIIDKEIPAKKYTTKKCFTKKGKKCGCKPCSVNKSLKGKNVLRCKEFWYFGESAICIDSESLKKIIHKGRGHSRIGKSEEEQKLVDDFYKWIREKGRKLDEDKSTCGKEKGIYGTPISDIKKPSSCKKC